MSENLIESVALLPAALVTRQPIGITDSEGRRCRLVLRRRDGPGRRRRRRRRGVSLPRPRASLAGRRPAAHAQTTAAAEGERWLTRSPYPDSPEQLDAATARGAGELLAATRSSETFDAVLVASAANRRARC
jgi:hypothetical protein